MAIASQASFSRKRQSRRAKHVLEPDRGKVTRSRFLGSPTPGQPVGSDRIFTYTRIYRAPDCARRRRESNIPNRDAIYSNSIVGRRKTGGATPARSIPAVAFARSETLLSGLRQDHYRGPNAGRRRNPRQPSAAAELSDERLHFNSHGLGAAH